MPMNSRRDSSTSAAIQRVTVRLVDLFVDDVTWGCATRARRADWLQAIADLQEDSQLEVGFAHPPAPQSLRAYITVGANAIRVAFHDDRGDERGRIELSRGVIAPIFREYMSLLQAISTLGETAYSPQVEALDIARRLMHNDAADLVIRHADGVIPDHRTARRLFTLFVLLTHDTTKLHAPTGL